MQLFGLKVKEYVLINVKLAHITTINSNNVFLIRLSLIVQVINIITIIQNSVLIVLIIVLHVFHLLFAILVNQASNYQLLFLQLNVLINVIQLAIGINLLISVNQCIVLALKFGTQLFQNV